MNTYARSAFWLAILGLVVLYGSRFAGKAASKIRV